MTISEREWLDVIEREYLSGYIDAGAGSVKFVVGTDRQIDDLQHELHSMAERHGLAPVAIDAAATKLHMIQDVFFAVARSLNWDAMAQRYMENLFSSQGYEWPRPGQAVPIHDIAERNQMDVTLLRREFHRWLTVEVMRDPEMTQDFRIAIARLCQRRLEPQDSDNAATTPVLEWLCGELRRIGDLKGTYIASKITRHNGRAMLRSLCRWLRLSGQGGLCIALDIRQLAKSGAAAGEGVRYSTAAVMDAFEVLRQLIDDAEHFSGMLLAVCADQSFIDDDPKRSVHAYRALQERIWSDVRAQGWSNPLAPLVELTSEAALAGDGGTE